ncbi:putative voltage-gated potassium channel subunit beta [Abeliophyllum distichum]|uniref:Voltage-gated potassium channel subunit beta n=1 Tax=Abeliophyllum distichum TaxID=126358 RepID=A0ABD1T1B1_9LAMI
MHHYGRSTDVWAGGKLQDQVPDPGDLSILFGEEKFDGFRDSLNGGEVCRSPASSFFQSSSSPQNLQSKFLSMKIPDQSMQYKNLGRSGLKVSQLSYGAWVTFGNQLDVKEAKSILQCCRDNGVNFFDNAEVYANGRAEEIMGQAIKELGWKRSDLVISTKIFWGGQGPNDKGLSRKHIVEGTKNSLKRLDMEYVDVLYCHRPDTMTPIEETVRAMNHVIDKGWAYYWGTSEWSAQQITEAWAVAERLDLVGPIVEQPEYNLLSRHKVELDITQGNIPPDSRFALENYKNLASRSLIDDVLRKVNGLKPIAEELGVPLSQLAIAWCASNPNVSSVITGATKESQIQENMKAVNVIPLLTPSVMEKIEAVVQTKPKRPDSYR